MAYSPHVVQVDVTWNTDKTLTAASLASVAEALDMEVKGFSSSVTVDSVVIDNYLAIPGTLNGIIIYQYNTSVYRIRIVFDEQLLDTVQVFNVSGTNTLYVHNISASIKRIGIIGTYGVVITSGKGTDGSYRFVTFMQNNSYTYLTVDDNVVSTTIASPVASTNKTLVGTNFIDFVRINFPAIDCIVDDTYFMAFNGTLVAGDVIIVSDRIYVIVTLYNTAGIAVEYIDGGV